MIEGFRLKVTSGELKAQCAARAEYHEGRAKIKETELPKLKDAMAAIQVATGQPRSVTQMSKGGYHSDVEDPVRDLGQDIRDHRNKALVFRFFSEHLFDEDYNLKEDDLVRLEILKR